MKNKDELYMDMISRTAKPDHDSYDKFNKYIKSVGISLTALALLLVGYLLYHFGLIG